MFHFTSMYILTIFINKCFKQTGINFTISTTHLIQANDTKENILNRTTIFYCFTLTSYCDIKNKIAIKFNKNFVVDFTPSMD